MTPPFRFLIPAGALLLAACGSNTPAASPSAPSAAPSPTPSASVAPAPGANASLPASCRALPPATGTSAGCHQEASDFLRAVTDAVAAAQNATAVDPDTKETYAVVQNGVIQSPNAYLKLIADALDRQGLCAVYDGEEMNVRNSSGFNELFDVVTGTGGSWTKYMSTCTPATPIPAVAVLPNLDPECKLAPSKDTYCDRAAPRYDADVSSALDELIAQDQKLANPVVFDFSRRAPGTSNGWRVANVPLYFSELRQKMRSRGYCNIYSGDDELLIKKGTNRFSEHWDLLSGEGYSLRLLAATCHDAAF
ncbi:MAG: hypothetical protein K1Y01_20400 [Vicinamibacteria bacterium]|nr:hypothetical protein [Vicinamibacteria bacterium]